MFEVTEKGFLSDVLSSFLMADFQVTLADLKTRTESLQEMNTQLAQQVQALEEAESNLRFEMGL